MNVLISKGLIEVLRVQFVLEWRGIHGGPHWSRVRVNGVILAKATGANRQVVELFAFLHDSMRLMYWVRLNQVKLVPYHPLTYYRLST
ncbi:hypothetical protein [Cycloclasticus pugetii]|uniref:hypothetical protein n=1 Tax=Cycloclasticus pugetii TaxID=34068 RepID=UPI0039E46AF2